MENLIWLSFDLGVRGDYEGMYAWLDDQKAKECGSSVAFFSYSHDGEALCESLKAEIEAAVSLDKRSRIYIVYREKTRLRGHFLVGRRKSAPWVGYGIHGEYDEVDVDGYTFNGNCHFT